MKCVPFFDYIEIITYFCQTTQSGIKVIINILMIKIIESEEW